MTTGVPGGARIRHLIVTVTPNPAIDVTYELDDPVAVGEVHRVRSVRSRAGGKGVNTARVLHSLGVDVVATGLGDGEFGHDLDIPHKFAPELAAVRRTVVIRDGSGRTTSFWEPGVTPSTGADEALRRVVDSRLDAASGLAICGSLPAGMDPELPARLAAEAAARDIPVVVDTSGAALRAALVGGHAVLMPNADELAELSGGRPSSPQQVADLGRELIAKHHLPALVATMGAAGLVAITEHGSWLARPPSQVEGNPTGAGDAACAAIVRHLAGGPIDWASAVADAVALSAAAVLTPVAGEVDVAAYRRWLPLVEVEEL